MASTAIARRHVRARSTAAVIALALVAAACGGPSDEPDGDRAPSASPAKTVTAQERANADLVMIAGEAEDFPEIGGFAHEGEPITSPGPTLRLTEGEATTLVLENVHGYVTNELIGHDLTFVAERDEEAEPLWGAETELLQPGESDLITFTPEAAGEYFYICSVIGHMDRHGMWGRLIVE